MCVIQVKVCAPAAFYDDVTYVKLTIYYSGDYDDESRLSDSSSARMEDGYCDMKTLLVKLCHKPCVLRWIKSGKSLTFLTTTSKFEVAENLDKISLSLLCLVIRICPIATPPIKFVL